MSKCGEPECKVCEALKAWASKTKIEKERQVVGDIKNNGVEGKPIKQV